MKIYHFVARAHPSATPFVPENRALATWKGLARIFPRALAVVLMPNHLHVLAPVDDPAETTARLQHLLGAISRWHRLPRGFDVPKPEKIDQKEKIRRNLRYVFLNPCRAHLCSDPLEWRWSSYRQVLGASHGTWADQCHESLSLLGWSGSGGFERLHAYVSADPAVNPAGSPFPSPFPLLRSKHGPEISLEKIWQAARAAHPESPDRAPLVRASFIAVARQQGWSQYAPLARYLRTSRSAIQYWADQVPNRALVPERTCLADARLRHWLTEASER